MLISLTTGDWSDDGHGKTAVDYFDVTNITSTADLRNMYTAGCMLLGYDLTDYCANYEDNTIPRNFYDALVEKTGPWKEDEEQPEEDGNEYTVYSEVYAKIWMRIAGLGGAEYSTTDVKFPDIDIGGYGLFY